MVHAYVMVQTAAGKSEELLSAIESIPPVEEAHIVAGDYDIIAEVDAGAVYDVLEAVSSDIQSHDGVTDTRTYIAMV
ncbi:Lrp/AsnC family transcriptional regulator [Halovivax limisalsi]|uniref:Lrp/AsnC family transcriptional regulator n=1 Tax=Halovivax limisalsi TaxID=1453760 RepID=UPI001FFDC829|nr:Lrp/AsnC ligand binding domain-containing protein [Halovivax limisalsi]